jgi:alcohol dehydrogenase
MRAIYFSQFQGELTVIDLPTPAAPDNGVVIEVKSTGLCRSDWHAWMGHDTDVVLPHVPGHELAGIVSELGAGITKFKVGDRVTVPFVNGCGKCQFCISGNAQVCPAQTQPGFTQWGSYAEYVSIENADFNMIALPDAISFSTAAALGCRFATAFRGLTARAKVQPGEWVAVFGCGGVGISAIMIAKALGARVIAIDISPAALAKASQLGADVTINSRESEAHARIIVITGDGVHVAIDALGSQITSSNSILSLRRRGRHLQLGLLLTPDGLTPEPMGRVIAYELDLLGSHGMSAADYPQMLAMVASGALRPDLLVDRTVGLNEGITSLQAMSNPTGTKVAGITIINPQIVEDPNAGRVNLIPPP